jgi:methionyl-tRNA formyltransferase
MDDLAVKYGFQLLKVRDINSSQNVDLIEHLRPDLTFVIGWSQLVNRRILEAASLGCVGIHPTQLPEGMGRAPIPWTLIKGMSSSAVTMFYLDEGADSGDIIAQKHFSIALEDDAGTILKRVSRLHEDLIRENLRSLLDGTANRRRQDHRRATYWKRRQPQNGEIEWSKGVRELYNWVRGLTHPFPGAFTFVNGRRLWVWKADAVEELEGCRSEPYGTVVGTLVGVGEGNSGVLVRVPDGRLVLRRVQLEGDEEKDALELLHNGSLGVGARLGS